MSSQTTLFGLGTPVLPLVVYLLGLAVFALGTSEFMLSGLLGQIAAELHVSIPSAGLLTSAFAVGMIFGAPLLAVSAARWSARGALSGFLLVFALAHLLSAGTDRFAVLLGCRILSALATAGFWALAQATAMRMVGPWQRGRAMSVVLGGVTIACVAGVPGGALLGQLWGWRSVFLAVAVLTLPAMLAILTLVPAGSSESAQRIRLGAELRAAAKPELLAVFALNALVQGATFCTFTYLGPLLTGVAGVSERYVSLLLVLFGLGAFLGVWFGGRLADRWPSRVLGTGMALLLLGWAVLLCGSGTAAVVFGIVFVQGMLAFGTGPALISRAFGLARGSASMTGAFTTAAFNIGNTFGPWFGGLAIGAGLGYRAPVGVSVLLMIFACLGFAVRYRLNSAVSPADATE